VLCVAVCGCAVAVCEVLGRVWDGDVEGRRGVWYGGIHIYV